MTEEVASSSEDNWPGATWEKEVQLPASPLPEGRADGRAAVLDEAFSAAWKAYMGTPGSNHQSMILSWRNAVEAAADVIWASVAAPVVAVPEAGEREGADRAEAWVVKIAAELCESAHGEGGPACQECYDLTCSMLDTPTVGAWFTTALAAVPVGVQPEPAEEEDEEWDGVLLPPSKVGMRFYRGTLVRCHCGEPAVRSEADEDGRMDAYCDRCTSVRCDAFPGACDPAVPVVHPEPGDRAGMLAEIDTLGPVGMPMLVDAIRAEGGGGWWTKRGWLPDEYVAAVRPHTVLYDENDEPTTLAAAVAAVRADVVLTLQTMAHGRPHYLSPALESTRQATLLEAAAAIEALP